MSEQDPSSGEQAPHMGGVDLDGMRGSTWGTSALICLSLAVAVVMAWRGVPVMFSSAGALVMFGALEPVRVWDGEVWRLVTACFVHVGAWHLGLNLWVLWQVGRVHERLVGTARFVLVYLVSGIFGFALSAALLPGVTAGASGAIFGVTGALLAVAAVARHKALGRFLVTALVPFVAATFALGFLLPMVNNLAHLGGLMMGFALGHGITATDERIGSLGADGAISHRISRRRAVLGNAALAVSVVAFAFTCAAGAAPRFSPRYHATLGLRALRALSLDPERVGADTRARAAHHVDEARRLAARDTATLMLEARAAEVRGESALATAKAQEAFAAAVVGDRTGTFDRILAELGGLEPDDEMPFVDGFTTRLLCDAALAPPDGDDGAVGDARQRAPLLKNSCAWLFARAREAAVRDAVRAVALATEAHAEAPENAAITHTLAVALAEADRAAEGLVLLERLEVSGKTGELGGAFVRAERERLAALAQAQAVGRPAAR